MASRSCDNSFPFISKILICKYFMFIFMFMFLFTHFHMNLGVGTFACQWPQLEVAGGVRVRVLLLSPLLTSSLAVYQRPSTMVCKYLNLTSCTRMIYERQVLDIWLCRSILQQWHKLDQYYQTMLPTGQTCQIGNGERTGTVSCQSTLDGKVSLGQ